MRLGITMLLLPRNPQWYRSGRQPRTYPGHRHGLAAVHHDGVEEKTVPAMFSRPDG